MTGYREEFLSTLSDVASDGARPVVRSATKAVHLATDRLRLQHIRFIDELSGIYSFR
ncbi:MULTISPECIES: hypothetical protein [Bacteria]|uniref:hypothetical protein n=1 Tax=Bacteria TaxID=2 RepID=UPI0014831B22|nr:MULTISPECIES: hypothetical protein [Bacteria]